MFGADVNECASRPCLNGGICDDHVNGYICTCRVGYTGDRCDAGQWYFTKEAIVVRTPSNGFKEALKF